MSVNPRYSGLLGGLAAAHDIMQEKGCTWEEAYKEWQASLSPPETNVIQIDFVKRERVTE